MSFSRVLRLNKHRKKRKKTQTWSTSQPGICIYPTLSPHPLLYTSRNIPFDPNPILDDFVSTNEFIIALNKCKNDKAPGADMISNFYNNLPMN